MHTPATCSIKPCLPLNNGTSSLVISKICPQDIRVTIRFSDWLRQFRLIGYQLDESHCDGHCDDERIMTDFSVFTWVWFLYLLSFFLSHLFWSTTDGGSVVRGPNFHSTNDGNQPPTMNIYSFHRFRPVVRVERRTDFQFRWLRTYNQSQCDRYLLYDKLLIFLFVLFI